MDFSYSVARQMLKIMALAKMRDKTIAAGSGSRRVLRMRGRRIKGKPAVLALQCNGGFFP